MKITEGGNIVLDSGRVLSSVYIDDMFESRIELDVDMVDMVGHLCDSTKSVHLTPEEQLDVGQYLKQMWRGFVHRMEEECSEKKLGIYKT